MTLDTRASDFVAFAKTLLVADGDLVAAASMRANERVRAITKAAVAAGTTTDTDWASALTEYRQVSAGFVESLRPISIFDRLLADNAIRRVPMRSRVVAVTTAATGAETAEGKPRKVSELALGEDTLPVRNVNATVVLSDEVARSASAAATAMLGTELRNGVAAASNGVFVDRITNGITATASAGATAANALTDIGKLLDGVALGEASRPYFVMNPARAKSGAMKLTTAGTFAFPALTPFGGSIVGIPVLVTDAVDTGEVLLIDGAGIAGDSDVVTLDASGQATLQMDDAPADPVAATTVVTSLWQHNLRALRAYRYFAVERFRDDAVAAISGAAW
jgi:HK97 family phage major capsid protein